VNDTTYAGYLLDQRRAAGLARENELIVAQRERGTALVGPQRRPLGTWLRTATHRTHRVGAVATGRSTTSVATR
jgi:hypothetical protein